MTDIDAAIAELKQTTVGYINKKWTTPPAGSHWQKGLDLLKPPTPPTYGIGFSSHIFSGTHDPPANYVNRLMAAKAKIFRDDLSSAITSGSPDTARLNSFLSLLAPTGAKLVLVLMNTPAPHPDLTNARNNAAAAVSFAEANFPGVLIAIEPRNEPNLNNNLSIAQYVAECNAIYDGVHSVSDKVKVWGGSTSGVGTRVWNGPIDWTEDCLKAGIKFDEWSCHPYYFTTGITAQNAVRLDLSTGFSRVFWYSETLASVLSRYGYWGPIHATEVGIPTDVYPSGTRINNGGFGTTNERVQADWLALAYDLWKAQPRAGYFCVYTGQDDNSSDTISRENHFGIYRSDNSAKPIVDVLKA